MIEWVRVDDPSLLVDNERMWRGVMRPGDGDDGPPIPLEASAMYNHDHVRITFGFQDREDFNFPTQTINREYAEVLDNPISFQGTLRFLLGDACREFRKKSAAERRARRLLSGFLSSAQRKQLNCCRYFHERGQQSREWYRFVWHSQAVKPVFAWGKGRLREVDAYYCLHPDNPYLMPIGDIILGQLLLLRSDETLFRRRANFHVTSSRLTESRLRRETVRAAALDRQLFRNPN